jgi:site-specific DNA-methyltransferase (cytosine-N4-specific)
MLNQCHIGDCRELLKGFAAAGVRAQMCVTSPPYWALRDYGVAGQIGLEPTLGEWVQTMVEVFRLVRDVLADDGTLWLNLGDAYNSGTSAPRRPSTADHGGWTDADNRQIRTNVTTLKPKDMMGQPWRAAFALQDDGWYLRQDIIWHKPNPMPETLTDRCTKAHEYLFLLSKAPRYFYDFDAMQEPVSGTANARGNGVNPKAVKMPDGWDAGAGAHGSFHRQGREKGKTRPRQNESFSGAVNELVEKRNRRSVWTIGTEPFDGAHFATFPRALVDPCILAGSRKGDVVLDPFMGSGTTAEAAEHLGRQWLGCELQPDYLPLQAKRLQQRAMAF